MLLTEVDNNKVHLTKDSIYKELWGDTYFTLVLERESLTIG